jgi:hydrogenase expression/formation protein HypE
MTMAEKSARPQLPVNPNPHSKRVVLAHGGGGQLTDQLVAEVIQPRLGNALLDPMGDSAVFEVSAGRMAFSTDSYVVQPAEFPGGDIGRLAVSGTVNDIAVSGAVPQYLSLGLILEEGLELDFLRRIIDSIAATAEEAGVKVTTGDTKVVARGQADGIYINTAGVGVMREDIELGVDRAQPGDRVLISGTVADHGLAVMLQREEAFGIESDLRSDAAPLSGLISDLLDACGKDVVFLRDPTRGGLAGVISDLAEKSGYRLTVDETRVPLRHETNYAAEMLGIDPFDVANEGKVVVVVRPDAEEEALQVMRAHELGRHAESIGEFSDTGDGLCEIVTEVGGRRIVQKPYGEEVPRIC